MLKKVLLFAGLLLLSFACEAGTQTGTVDQIFVRASDGLVYFFLSGAATGQPSCATRNYWIIKDENSNAGKQQLAELMEAKASGQTITVIGWNTCDRWGDGEDVNILELD
jgi:hypothetical protein